jgi:hypothetical protein
LREIVAGWDKQIAVETSDIALNPFLSDDALDNVDRCRMALCR